MDVFVKTFGTELFQATRSNVTKNVQIGFGTFVDKTLMPFATDSDIWFVLCVNVLLL